MIQQLDALFFLKKKKRIRVPQLRVPWLFAIIKDGHKLRTATSVEVPIPAHIEVSEEHVGFSTWTASSPPVRFAN